MNIIKKGDCEYCQNKNINVRATYYIADRNSCMCKKCWEVISFPVKFNDVTTVF